MDLPPPSGADSVTPSHEDSALAPPMTDPEAVEVAHDVVRTLRQIMRRVAEHSRYLSNQVGLTLPQLMCLKAVGELEGESIEDITVAKVAARVQFSPTTVSRIVDRLVSSQLLERARPTEDRRKVRLSLSASGRERFAALPVPLQEEFVQRFSELPVEERLRVLNTLRMLSELMGAQDLDVAPLLDGGEMIKPEPQ